MSFQAKDVMSAASNQLQDSGAIRWVPTELLSYLNEGVREIVAIKPNANSQTVLVTLAAGAKQTLGATYTVLSRAIRNSVSGKPIRVLENRELLDTQIPGWMNTTNLAFSLDVSYIVQDQTDPRTFYVAPGALVTSVIEIVVGVMPADVASGSNLLDIATFTGVVGLPDLYRNALIDYTLHRAYAKDSGLPNAAARSQAHRQLFDTAIGNIGAAENAMSIASFSRGPSA
jgi:hypothetical protein